VKVCELWFDNCRQDFVSLEVMAEFNQLLKQMTTPSTSKELKEVKDAAKKLKRRAKSFMRELQKTPPKTPAGGGTGGVLNPLFFETMDEQRNYLLSNLEEKKFPKPAMSKRKSTKSELDIEKLDYCETARQLTLIDHYLLKKVTNSEFFSVAWEKKSKDIEAPNIVNFIARFNQVLTWSHSINGNINVLN